ncbi:MAG: PAS domain-containing protein [Dongiaceae bacterium]
MDSRKSLITAEWGVLNFGEPILQRLHEYWCRQRGTRAMPARPDIDAAEIPALLPYIFVIDVLEEHRDFRFRVAGTHLREALGEELTGRHIADAFPADFGGEVKAIWSQVVDQRIPVRGWGDLWIPGREFVKWEGLAMPLSADGEAVNMLLGAVIFPQLAYKRP